MKYVIVLFLLLTSLNVKAQYVDPMELHDSIFLNLYINDSIEYANWIDSSYNAFPKKEENYCLTANPESYINDVNLYDFTLPYVLLFEDNFDYLNKGFWNIIDDCNSECWTDPNVLDPEDCDPDNKHVQYFDDKNVKIRKNSDGNSILEITAYYDPAERLNNTNGKRAFYDFTSGFIHSKKAFPFEAGIFQARIKLPEEINYNGLQPAFWLMSQGSSPWHELDIFEFFASDREMSTTFHVNPNELGRTINQMCQKSFNRLGYFFNRWITYTCYWNKFSVVIFIDWEYELFGKIHHEKKCIQSFSHFANNNKRSDYKKTDIPKNTTVSRRLYYPSEPMRVMINLYTYFCDEKHKDGYSEFPAKMEVDWVKIWYKAPCHKDLIINDISQIPNNPDLYNYLSGRNITINCEYNIPDGMSLKIAHSGNLISNKNIVVGSQGYLEITPEISKCDWNPNAPNLDEKDDDLQNADRLVENIENSSPIHLYPNPIQNEVIIKSYLPELLLNSKVKIYNSYGILLQEQLIQQDNSQTCKLEVNLLPGIYLIEILKNDNIIFVNKLVKI